MIIIILNSSLKPKKHLWIDEIARPLILISSENCDHEEASNLFVAPDGAAPNLKNCLKWCHLSQLLLGLKITSVDIKKNLGERR